MTAELLIVIILLWIVAMLILVPLAIWGCSWLARKEEKKEWWPKELKQTTKK